MLLYAQADYIANDRTILQLNERGDLLASAYPSNMNLGVGTYQNLKGELDVDLTRLKGALTLTKFKECFNWIGVIGK